jgi:hypothetical protein
MFVPIIIYKELLHDAKIFIFFSALTLSYSFPKLWKEILMQFDIGGLHQTSLGESKFSSSVSSINNVLLNLKSASFHIS